MIKHLIENARTRVLAGCLLAACPLLAVAAPEIDAAAPAAQGCDRGPSGHGHDGPPPGMPHVGGAWGPGGPGGPGVGEFGMQPPPYLHELKLSEDQQDKVFTIMHGAEPAMRDAAKAAHKAHDALRDAGSSPQYDEKTVNALVQSQVKADGQMTLLRVKTEHDIYGVLTPEQRSKLTQLKQEHEAHRHDGPPR